MTPLTEKDGFQMKRNRIVSALLAAALALLTLCSCGKKEKNYVTLPEDFGSEEYAIGFRPGDVALAKEVQQILDEMAADGTSKEISEKWFGTNLIVSDRDYPKDQEPASDDTSLEDLKSRGKFVLGLDDSFPPMGFRDENNEIVGVDIDLAAEVCKRLGVELVVQPIDWDSKELELTSGKIDCIWNGMTVTEERIEAMFLSKPYLDNRQVVIVEEGSKIASVSDLAGKTVGLQKGSSAREAFDANPIASEVAQVVEYEDNVDAFLDLQAGRIDALLVDEVAGNYIIETYSKNQ